MLIAIPSLTTILPRPTTVAFFHVTKLALIKTATIHLSFKMLITVVFHEFFYHPPIRYALIVATSLK